jgi:hypothetical protein
MPVHRSPTQVDAFRPCRLRKSALRVRPQRVGKYMIRPLLSLERPSFSEKEGKVGYRYGKEAKKAEKELPINYFLLNGPSFRKDALITLLKLTPSPLLE